MAPASESLEGESGSREPHQYFDESAPTPLPLWAIAVLGVVSLASTGAGVALAIAGTSDGVRIGAYIALALGTVSVGLAATSILERKRFIQRISQRDFRNVEDLLAQRMLLNARILTVLMNAPFWPFRRDESDFDNPTDEVSKDLVGRGRTVMRQGALLDAELVALASFERWQLPRQYDPSPLYHTELLALNPLGHEFARAAALIRAELGNDARDIAWLGDRNTADRILALLEAITPSEPPHLGQILQ
jgi:hypothetical protein